MESVTTPQALPGGPTAGLLSPHLVTVRTDELIVGRVVRYPIYDAHGVLLLAEGLSFTEDLRRTLEKHDIHTVQVHADDFKRLTFGGETKTRSLRPTLDAGLMKKIDEVVDTGLLFVVNSESALLDQVSQHGCTSYDRQRYLDRINRNKETSIFVDNLIHNATQGQAIDCGEVMRLTASYFHDLTSDLDSTLASLLDVIRRSSIADHCVAMAVLGMALGVEMGLDAQNVRTIAVAGLLHDWGMAQVPEEIREQTRHLTEEEFFEIAKHPCYTLRLLDQMFGVPPSVPLICYQVHERPNGQGYPQGRRGTRIHLMARILAVADAYHALISPRPYRPPLTPYAAMECLLRQAATGDFDPQVVRALLRVQTLFPLGSYLVLSDGSVARSLRRNGDNFLRPIVQIVQDAEGHAVPEDSETAILDLGTCDLQVVQALGPPGTEAIGLRPDVLQFNQRDGGLLASVPELNSPSPPLEARAASGPAEPPQFTDLEAYTERQQRLANCALELLRGTRSLTDRQHGTRRQHPRVLVQMVATVCLVDSDEPRFQEARSGPSFRVPVHDISQGGLGFLHPGAIRLGKVLVGLPLNDNDSDRSSTWFVGELVRNREVGDTGFWDHGVALQQRVPL